MFQVQTVLVSIVSICTFDISGSIELLRCVLFPVQRMKKKKTKCQSDCITIVNGETFHSSNNKNNCKLTALCTQQRCMCNLSKNSSRNSSKNYVQHPAKSRSYHLCLRCCLCCPSCAAWAAAPLQKQCAISADNSSSSPNPTSGICNLQLLLFLLYFCCSLLPLFPFYIWCVRLFFALFLCTQH